MALNSMGLGLVFQARDLASQTMRGVQRELRETADEAETQGDRMRRGMKDVATGLGLITAGATGLAGSMKFATAAGEFEQGLGAVAQISGATAEELKSLTEAATEAGMATKFSPKEAVDGLLSLAAAGQSAKEQTDTLIPVLDLATGSLGQLGVAGAAEAVVGTLKAYGMEADRAAEVTDKLLKTTQISNFQARDFEAGLAKAAATGAVFNQSLDDVLVTMGLLRNMNIDASSSATAVREAFRRMGSDPGAQKTLKELGVQIADTNGEMRSAIEITQDLIDSTSGMTDVEQKAIATRVFGARGLMAFNAVMNAQAKTMRDGQEVTLKGAEAIEVLRGELSNASGAASEFREAWTDNFKGALEIAGGVAQTFVISVGRAFARVLRPAIESITAGITRMIEMWDALPRPVQNAIAGALVATSALLGVAGVLFLIKGAALIARVALAFVGKALLAMAVPLAKFILIGMALAAVALAIKKAWEENLGGFADIVGGIFNKVKLVVQAMVQLFRDGGFSGALRDELNKAENKGIAEFAAKLFSFLMKLKAFFAGVVEGFLAGVEFLRPVFTMLGQAIRSVVSAVGKIIRALFGMNREAQTGRSTWEALGNVVGWVASLFTGTLGIALTTVLEILAGLLELVAAVVQAIRDLIELLPRAGRKLGDFAWWVRRTAGKIPGVARAADDTGIETTAGVTEQMFGISDTDGGRRRRSPGFAPDAIVAADRERGTDGVTSSDIDRLVSQMGNQPIEVRSTVELDGDVVGEVVERRNRDDAGRRFAGPGARGGAF